MHPDTEQTLLAWHADVKQANWRSPSDTKKVYRNAGEPVPMTSSVSEYVDVDAA